MKKSNAWFLPVIGMLFLVLVIVSCEHKTIDSKKVQTDVLTEKELQAKYPGYLGVDLDYRHAGSEALERWQDWKFGLRIHWGLYCMVGGYESWILKKSKTKEFIDYYGTLWQFFNPEKFDAENWMHMIKDAGMKYFTFTTKHHDGFCMWDTKTYQQSLRMVDGFGVYDTVNIHYSIMDTEYRQDIVQKIVEAGRKAGLGVGLYYSHIDWHDPAFAWDTLNVHYDPDLNWESDPERWQKFIQQERDQLTELMTNYGKIDLLSLDMGWPDWAQADAYEVAKMVRKHQSEILIRHRGIGPYGDYSTPEREIPLDPNDAHLDKPWQVIYPNGQAFSYLPNDSYKPASWILESLIDITAKGGNFQVGFGPKPNGEWDDQIIERLRYVGAWLKVNGESIYNTRPYRRYKESDNTRYTRTKDWKYVYAISLTWPGDEYVLKYVRAKDKGVIRLIGYDKKLNWHQDDEKLVIEMPDELQDPANRPCEQAYAFKIENAGFTTKPVIITAMPEISKEPVSVSIKCEDKQAKIYYTLDGSEPGLQSELFREPFTIKEPTVIFAKAYASGKIPSDVAQEEIYSTDNGIHYSYYEGKWKMLPDFDQMKPVTSGTIRNFDISYHRRPDHWGYKFTGYLKVFSPGEYTFATNSDDGSKLYINGQLIVDNDGSHSVQIKTGNVYLTEGMHPFKVVYFEDYDSIKLQVLYAAPGQELKPIPGSIVYLTNNL